MIFTIFTIPAIHPLYFIRNALYNYKEQTFK